MALYEPQSFFDPGQSWTENDNVPYAVNNNGISGTYGENGDTK